MIPFDVSSLFTMVPQDYIIDLTLKQIYGDKEIETRCEKPVIAMYQESSLHFQK